MYPMRLRKKAKFNKFPRSTFYCKILFVQAGERYNFMNHPVEFINEHPAVCCNILWTCGFEMHVLVSNAHRTLRQEKFLTVIPRAA
jgi:hypothetical protein